MRSSIADYPSELYSKVLISNQIVFPEINNKSSISYDQIRSSTLAVNIFYERMEYTELTESQSKTIIILISSIGGSLGLFMGIKFASFIELAEIGIEFFFLIYKKNKIC